MQEQLSEKYSSFRDYLKVVFKHKKIVLATIFLTLLTTYIGLQLRTPVYVSEVKMLSLAKKYVESPYYKDIAEYDASSITLTQSEIVTSNPVVERVVKRLRLNESLADEERAHASPLKLLVLDLQSRLRESKYSDLSPNKKQELDYQTVLKKLKKKIKVKQIKDTGIIKVSVTDYDPQNAARIANVVSRSYCLFDLEQQMAELKQKYGDKHLTIQQLRDNIRDMEDNLSRGLLPSIEAIGPASVKILEQATVPLEPTGVSEGMIMLTALFVSIFLGILLAFTFEGMDTKLGSTQDIKEQLGLNSLGYIPRPASSSAKLLLLLRGVLVFSLWVVSILLILRILSDGLGLDTGNPLIKSLAGLTDPFIGASQSGPGINLVAILLLVGFLVIGTPLAMILSRVSKKLSRRSQVIKKLSKKTALTRSYQELSEKIFLLLKENGQKTVLLTSLDSAQGTTSIVINLGRYLAKNSRKKILLIDTNTRTPHLRKCFKTPKGSGLEEVLEGVAGFDQAVVNVSSNLYILPAGNTAMHPANFLASSKLPDLIKRAEDDFGVVLLDCTDIKASQDALTISSFVDTVILVVDEGKTRREAAKALLEPFFKKQVNFLGAILNNRKFFIPGILYERT